jgi:hypothetical protein
MRKIKQKEKNIKQRVKRKKKSNKNHIFPSNSTKIKEK